MNRRIALNAFAVLAIALLLASFAVAPARAAAPANDDDLSPCTLSGGTLSTVLTPDNDVDFVVFGLYDDHGEQVAKQMIPIYSPSASAELMITPIGFAGTVTTAKCLADSPVKRCVDPQWQTDEGLIVALAGFVLGPDYAIATVAGRYKRPASTTQLAIDGGVAGFALDKSPPQWSSFYDSQQEASEAFFNLAPGEHTLTIGSRDPQSGNLVPQERLCFRV